MRRILSENKTELKHSKNKLFKLKTNDDNFTMQHRISYGTHECHISQTICHNLTQHYSVLSNIPNSYE